MEAPVNQPTKKHTAWAGLWVVAALTLLAFGLRLYRIDADSIWWDEGISLDLARGTWAALLEERASNVHPPLYFVLLKLWQGVAGDSVFASRGFSLIFTLPGVALAYDVARRASGHAAGMVAGALAAVGAVFLVHAQDVRAYGLLPMSTLLMLALADRLARCPKNRRLWAALAVVEATTLLLHYLSAFAVLYVNARLVVQLWPQRRDVWRAWLASQAGAFALILPWVAFVLSHHAEIRAHLALNATPYVARTPLPELVALVWTFLMTGHAATRFIAPLPLLTILLAGSAALAAVWAIWKRPAERGQLAWSTFDWLLPIVGVTTVWLVRPLAHPRYTMLWSGALWVWVGIVLGGLLRDRRWAGRTLGAAGLLVALALNGLAINAHLFNPRLAKHDVRGVAAMLRQRAAPGDVALSPLKDRSLRYYDTAPASVAMIDFRDPDAAWGALAQATEDARHVYVLEYEHATRDPLGFAAYALERTGTLEEIIPFWGLEVFAYRLDEQVAPPALQSVEVDLGPARLVGVSADPAPSDEVLAVALAWELDEPGAPLKATVQLQDHLGNKIAQDDRPLLSPLGRTSDDWPPGETVVNTYLLPLPKGTPPVTYDLAIGLYPAAETRPGDLQPVMTITLLSPLGTSADPYKVGNLGLDPDIAGELAPGLRLTGAAYAPREVRPGATVDVMLRWLPETTLPSLEPALRLEAGGSILSDVPQQPVGGDYPTDAWIAGQTVLERRRLTIPTDAPPDKLTLTVAIGEEAVTLGDLAVDGGSTFEPPQPQVEMDAQFGQVARLIGYSLSSEQVSQTEGIRLTLYWQALEAVQTDYTVFTHLVDANGILVGQHDYPPVWGVRPTSSWQPGEYLVDVHEVQLLDGVSPAPGALRLAVGLYDPATLERVPLAGGSDAALLDTIVELSPAP